MSADSELMKAFANYMESEGAVIMELFARVRSLERYLKAHDASFWAEYNVHLTAARAEAKSPFGLLKLLTDESAN